MKPVWPDVAVVTQDPRFGGGALTQLRAFVEGTKAIGSRSVRKAVPDKLSMATADCAKASCAQTPQPDLAPAWCTSSKTTIVR